MIIPTAAELSITELADRIWSRQGKVIVKWKELE